MLSRSPSPVCPAAARSPRTRAAAAPVLLAFMVFALALLLGCALLRPALAADAGNTSAGGTAGAAATETTETAEPASGAATDSDAATATSASATSASATSAAAAGADTDDPSDADNNTGSSGGTAATGPEADSDDGSPAEADDNADESKPNPETRHLTNVVQGGIDLPFYLASIPTTNPYPDVISDEELAASKDIAIMKTRLTWLDPDTGEQKSGFVSGGLVPTRGTVLRAEIYIALNSNYEYINQLTGAVASAGAVIEFFGQDEAGGTIVASTSREVPTTVELNGTVMTDAVAMDRTAIETGLGSAFDLSATNYNQYYKFTLDFPTGTPVNSIYILTGVIYTSGVTNVSTPVMYLYLYPVADTTFHYVTEAAYRNALGLSSSDAIAPRSAANSTAFNNLAFTGLSGLSELASPVTTSNIFHLNGNGNQWDTKTPVYALGAEAKTNGSVINGEYKPGQANNSNIDGTAMPTYVDLVNVSIPGYVYVANDIDTVPSTDDVYDVTTRGNWYSSGAWLTADSFSMHKHYYILYRPLPSTVVITKTDAADSSKTLAGATFDLYTGTADELGSKILTGLTTNEDGQIVLGDTAATIESLEIITQLADGASIDASGSVLTHEGKTYLFPGNYVLVETAAPEAYMLNTEPVAFSVGLNSGEEAATISVSISNTAENVILPSPLLITKTDAGDSNTVLAGAVFDLYTGTADELGDKILTGLTTDENGQIALGDAQVDVQGLEAALRADGIYASSNPTGAYRYDGQTYLFPGDYVLVETTAPEGYVLSSTPLAFSIPAASDNGVSAFLLSAVNSKETPDEPTEPEVPVTPETPEVPSTPEKPSIPAKPETPGKDIPKTGTADGYDLAASRALLAGGLLMLGASGAALLIKRRCSRW